MNELKLVTSNHLNKEEQIKYYEILLYIATRNKDTALIKYYKNILDDLYEKKEIKIR